MSRSLGNKRPATDDREETPDRPHEQKARAESCYFKPYHWPPDPYQAVVQIGSSNRQLKSTISSSKVVVTL